VKDKGTLPDDIVKLKVVKAKMGICPHRKPQAPPASCPAPETPTDVLMPASPAASPVAMRQSTESREIAGASLPFGFWHD